MEKPELCCIKVHTDMNTGTNTLFMCVGNDGSASRGFSSDFKVQCTVKDVIYNYPLVRPKPVFKK